MSRMLPSFLYGVGRAASPGLGSSYDYYVTKTCTYQKCDGVSKPRIWRDGHIMANNLGLPNPGISYYETSKHTNTPFVLSVHPDCFWNKYDFTKLPQHIRVLEVNISCPNTTYGMIGYDLHMLYQLLKRLPIHDYTIGLKMPYYADRTFAEKIGRMCKHAGVHYIVCCNSLTGYVTTPDSDDIICGVTSPYFKPLVLSNCKWFADLGLSVVGCGGIRSTSDIEQYRNVGCIGVQISGPAAVASKL